MLVLFGDCEAPNWESHRPTFICATLSSRSTAVNAFWNELTKLNIFEMSGEIEDHITKRYEIKKRLGKGVSSLHVLRYFIREHVVLHSEIAIITLTFDTPRFVMWNVMPMLWYGYAIVELEVEEVSCDLP